MISSTKTLHAGTVEIETGAVDETAPVVIVNVMGAQIDLAPAEAVHIAVRLIEAASRAEREPVSEWP